MGLGYGGLFLELGASLWGGHLVRSVNQGPFWGTLRILFTGLYYTPLRTLINKICLMSSWVLYKQK